MPNPENCLLVSFKTLATETKQEGLANDIVGHLGLSDAAGFLDVMKAERKLTKKVAAKTALKRDLVFETSSGFFKEVVRLVDNRGTCPLSESKDAFEEVLQVLCRDRVFFDEAIAFSERVQDADIRAYQAKAWRLYAHTLAQIDAEFAGDLETAFKETPKPVRLSKRDASGKKKPANEKKPPKTCVRTRYYDCSGLFTFTLRTGAVTGIQRVQRESIRGAAASGVYKTNRAAYFDQNYGWRSISLEAFVELFADVDEKLDKLLDFAKTAEDLPGTNFFDCDILYFLGATWDNSGLLRWLPNACDRWTSWLDGKRCGCQANHRSRWSADQGVSSVEC